MCTNVLAAFLTVSKEMLASKCKFRETVNGQIKGLVQLMLTANVTTVTNIPVMLIKMSDTNIRMYTMWLKISHNCKHNYSIKLGFSITKALLYHK